MNPRNLCPPCRLRRGLGHKLGPWSGLGPDLPQPVSGMTSETVPGAQVAEGRSEDQPPGEVERALEEQEPQRLVVSRTAIRLRRDAELAGMLLHRHPEVPAGRGLRKSRTRRGTWGPSPQTATIGSPRPRDARVGPADVRPMHDVCGIPRRGPTRPGATRPGPALGDPFRDPVAMSSAKRSAVLRSVRSGKVIGISPFAFRRARSSACAVGAGAGRSRRAGPHGRPRSGRGPPDAAKQGNRIAPNVP